MANENASVTGVLVLAGGRTHSTAPSRPWQLANLRMAWLARSLRHRLGDRVMVRRVRYRLRGWNSPALDPVRDAETALFKLRREVGSHVVLVGHSMGARVAVHLAAAHGVGGIVALAPWWPVDDADLVPPRTPLLTVHGTADTWTNPRSTKAQTLRAAERGVDARWVGVPGAGHYLLRKVGLWHRLTATFISEHLDPTVRPSERPSWPHTI